MSKRLLMCSVLISLVTVTNHLSLSDSSLVAYKVHDYISHVNETCKTVPNYAHYLQDKIELNLPQKLQ